MFIACGPSDFEDDSLPKADSGLRDPETAGGDRIYLGKTID